MMPPASESFHDDPKPQPPQAPETWECCHSGCDPCVYDLYWQALERYEAALKQWESHRGAGGNAT